MSSVVLRCPNCGTTRAASGECEACHEAQVRYYCTNHTPGRWLDTPSCLQCGARFGEPMGVPVRPAPAAPKRMPTPSPRAAPRPPPPPAGRPMAGEDSSRGSGRLPPAEYEEIDMRDEYAPRGVSLHDLLRAVTRARRVPPDAVSDRETVPPSKLRLGGCLGRFVLIVVLLFFALTGGLFMLGGSLFRLFFPF